MLQECTERISVHNSGYRELQTEEAGVTPHLQPGVALAEHGSGACIRESLLEGELLEPRLGGESP